VGNEDAGEVSILVVLDLALQRAVGSYYLQKEKGFNPCCIGFSVATPALALNTGRREFQSLLYWI